jgi:hypothetical protein
VPAPKSLGPQPGGLVFSAKPIQSATALYQSEATMNCLLAIAAAALLGLLSRAGFRFYSSMVAAEMAKHEKQGEH